MARGEVPQAFGVSFLDLISCGLGGVLVLYTLAELPANMTSSKTLGYIQVQVERQQPVTLGLSFVVDGRTYSSWNNDSEVTWITEPGSILALFDFAPTNLSPLQVIALDPDHMGLPEAIHVFAQTSAGHEAAIQLRRAQLYRARLL